MSNIEDTIYDLPNEEYHRGERFKDFLSSTQIKDYMVSPKFARYKALHPELFEISIEASEKGSLYHDAMESLVNTGKLDKWRNNLLVFEPPINPKTDCPYGRDTQKYQIALIEAKESNPGKTLTSTTDIQLVETMVYELLNNCRDTSKQIRQILKWGKAEVSHFVEYEGCKFKYRPDVETAKKIVDWKTLAVDDLHEETVNRTIAKFHYGISAAFYQFFEHERTGVWKEFYWVMQQKIAPYDAVFVSAANWAFHLEDGIVKMGDYGISAAFYQFFEHERTGVWKEFYWVMQQKTAPYDAVFVSAANWAFHLEDGIVKMGASALAFKKLLDQHVYCTQNNDFDGAQIFIQPGFKGRRIMVPDTPAFEKNKMFNFYNNQEQ